MVGQPEKALSRLITCKKCGWSYSSQKGNCPMCGQEPAPMGEEELASALMRLIERKGLLIDDNEARKFIRKFKKESKRFPDEKDLIRAANEYVKIQSMSSQELKAKEIVDKKLEKQTKDKEAAGEGPATLGKKEVKLDLSKKIEELKQKRAKDKQKQLEAAKAKSGRKGEEPEEIEEEEEVPVIKETPPLEPTIPPQAPAEPIPSPKTAEKEEKSGAPASKVVTGEEKNCPRCKYVNPKGSYFCLECGNPL